MAQHLIPLVRVGRGADDGGGAVLAPLNLVVVLVGEPARRVIVRSDPGRQISSSMVKRRLSILWFEHTYAAILVAFGEGVITLLWGNYQW